MSAAIQAVRAGTRANKALIALQALAGQATRAEWMIAMKWQYTVSTFDLDVLFMLTTHRLVFRRGEVWSITDDGRRVMTFGIAIRNPNTDVLVLDETYPIPEFIGKVTLNPNPVQNGRQGTAPYTTRRHEVANMPARSGRNAMITGVDMVVNSPRGQNIAVPASPAFLIPNTYYIQDQQTPADFEAGIQSSELYVEFRGAVRRSGATLYSFMPEIAHFYDYGGTASQDFNDANYFGNNTGLVMPVIDTTIYD